MATTQVKERPILMSAAMVRALLEGRKTQTRRVVKPGPPPCQTNADAIYPYRHGWRYTGVEYACELDLELCPYGKPGDRLWVRETFFSWSTKVYSASGVTVGPEQAVYRADGGTLLNGAKWKPSIFMPRWASRITLEITEVRVQRLRDISANDCRAEGFACGDARVRSLFATAWNNTYGIIAGKEQGWNANPFVWVIMFKRILTDAR